MKSVWCMNFWYLFVLNYFGPFDTRCSGDVEFLLKPITGIVSIV